MLQIGAAVADAVAKAHSASVLHRDLKPSNIVVAEDGAVKVLDFGLATLVEPVVEAQSEFTRTLAAGPISKEGMVVGTHAYMSPEKAEGRKLDARTDIFSFGAVLYEITTGKRAFRGDSTASVIAAVLREDPPLPTSVNPELPRELERIIPRCLRKDPGRRFQHMSDVRVALLELKDESESGSLAVTAAPPSRSRRRGVWRAVGVVVLCAGALLAAFLLFAPDRSHIEPDYNAIPIATNPGANAIRRFRPMELRWHSAGMAGAGTVSMYTYSLWARLEVRFVSRTRRTKRNFCRNGRPTVDGSHSVCWDRAAHIIAVPALGGPEKVVSSTAKGRA